MLMDVYCHVLLKSGGYLTEKHQLHLPRIELFLQMLSRKEPLYFEQRAIDEGEEHYATANYKDYYYLVSYCAVCYVIMLDTQCQPFSGKIWDSALRPRIQAVSGQEVFRRFGLDFVILPSRMHIVDLVLSIFICTIGI